MFIFTPSKLSLWKTQASYFGLQVSFKPSQICPRPLARQDSTQEISCSVSKEEIGRQALIKASIWVAWIWLYHFSLFKTFYTPEKSIWSPTLENNDFSLAKNFYSQVCRNADEAVHKVYWQATSAASRRSQSQDWLAPGWAMIEGANANFCFFEFYFDWPWPLGKTAKSWIRWRT